MYKTFICQTKTLCTLQVVPVQTDWQSLTSRPQDGTQAATCAVESGPGKVVGDIHARFLPRYPRHRAAMKSTTLNSKHNEKCAIFVAVHPQEVHETDQLRH